MGRTHQQKDSPRAQRVGSAPINGRANGQRRLRLRVNNGPDGPETRLLLIPDQRTSSDRFGWFVSCQNRTYGLREPSRGLKLGPRRHKGAVGALGPQWERK